MHRRYCRDANRLYATSSDSTYAYPFLNPLILNLARSLVRRSSRVGRSPLALLQIGTELSRSSGLRLPPSPTIHHAPPALPAQFAT